VDDFIKPPTRLRVFDCKKHVWVFEDENGIFLTFTGSACFWKFAKSLMYIKIPSVFRVGQSDLTETGSIWNLRTRL
jgi:hypothetical protein